jgi:hypothetical protein
MTCGRCRDLGIIFGALDGRDEDSGPCPDCTGAVMRIRFLRGQIVVRECTHDQRGPLWLPRPDEYKVKIHRGIVLGMGPSRLRGDLEIPHGFEVGDEVLYIFTHLKDGWTLPWPLDGEPATWLPVENVQAVLG